MGSASPTAASCSVGSGPPSASASSPSALLAFVRPAWHRAATAPGRRQPWRCVVDGTARVGSRMRPRAGARAPGTPPPKATGPVRQWPVRRCPSAAGVWTLWPWPRRAWALPPARPERQRPDGLRPAHGVLLLGQGPPGATYPTGRWSPATQCSSASSTPLDVTAHYRFDVATSGAPHAGLRCRAPSAPPPSSRGRGDGAVSWRRWRRSAFSGIDGERRRRRRPGRITALEDAFSRETGMSLGDDEHRGDRPRCACTGRWAGPPVGGHVRPAPGVPDERGGAQLVVGRGRRRTGPASRSSPPSWPGRWTDRIRVPASMTVLGRSHRTWPRPAASGWAAGRRRHRRRARVCVAASAGGAWTSPPESGPSTGATWWRCPRARRPTPRWWWMWSPSTRWSAWPSATTA